MVTRTITWPHLTSKMKNIKGNVLYFKFLEGPHERLSENTVNSQPLSKLNLKQPKGHMIRSIQFWSHDSPAFIVSPDAEGNLRQHTVRFFSSKHIICCIHSLNSGNWWFSRESIIILNSSVCRAFEIIYEDIKLVKFPKILRWKIHVSFFA